MSSLSWLLDKIFILGQNSNTIVITELDLYQKYAIPILLLSSGLRNALRITGNIIILENNTLCVWLRLVVHAPLSLVLFLLLDFPFFIFSLDN